MLIEKLTNTLIFRAITAFYRIGQSVVVCINFVIPDSVGPIFSTCTVLRNNNNNNNKI